MIFKPLTKEEYDRLSLEERMDYLQRLVADINQKVQESRQQLAEAQKRRSSDTPRPRQKR
jgi:hypothetical protein